MESEQHLLISIINIILIDLILGGDNAVVIALACRRLPEKQRNKAIILGTGLAVVIRISLIAIMVSLLKIPYLLLIGGIFLVYIALKLVIEKGDDLNIKAGHSLFSAVRTIVLADVVMGLDNVLGIAGASHGNLSLVLIGILISVPIIIWGSKIILTAMEYMPALIYIGSAVLAYTASGMVLEEPKLSGILADYPQIKMPLTIFLIAGVLLVGWLVNRSKSEDANHHI
ncbi:YjbE family integral membrane protein [Scopulibacillus daqui]|uniref:YjbE family integral membrane protein n=1 Tax=Scopulibacillus daqui TaxID=1469162 RepID=A0ABS2PVP1_9BACL|nr:TerC family protein [Scopulibacillus daqui]MBM7644033.1 YjbE family integral membrane protein [Scopulibacillus daqui]